MRPCFWTSYFIDHSPEEAIELFAMKGWSELEISDEHAKTLLDRGDPVKVGAKFKEYLSDKGVTVPQGHLWLNCDLAAPDESEVISHLKKWLDLFLTLGVRAAVIHPGGRIMRSEGAPEEDIFKQQVKILECLVAHIRGSDMSICLENCSSDIDQLLPIIEAVGADHTGICLDTGHLHRIHADQSAFIHRAGTLLKALHINDNDGSSDQHLLPYGSGTLSWEEVINALKEIQYPHMVNLEVPGERRCPLPVRLAKLDYAKRLLEWMINQ